jgi:SAM-dependent methyltransferase
MAKYLEDAVAAASLACGHARELELLSPESLRRLRFWGLDQDAKSIAFCRARLGVGAREFVLGSVADVLRGSTTPPDADIVYASGLFDYLDDRVGAALVRRMFGAVKPGGKIIVANLTPANEEIAYMEAVMDWWMCYRDEAALAAMAERARLDSCASRLSTYTTSDGRVAWLVIERLA